MTLSLWRLYRYLFDFIGAGRFDPQFSIFGKLPLQVKVALMEVKSVTRSTDSGLCRLSCIVHFDEVILFVLGVFEFYEAVFSINVNSLVVGAIQDDLEITIRVSVGTGFAKVRVALPVYNLQCPGNHFISTLQHRDEVKQVISEEQLRESNINLELGSTVCISRSDGLVWNSSFTEGEITNVTQQMTVKDTGDLLQCALEIP